MSLLTGIKDLDLKIFSELDDISLLNFCRQNESNEYVKKLCFDENFWRNRTINRYGKLLEKNYSIYKNPERTWRNFYLKIIYYDDNYTPNKVIKELVKGGGKNLDLINFFINSGANDWDNPMCEAVKYGYVDLVIFFINKGGNKDMAMNIAVRMGNMELIQLLIDMGSNNWNQGMRNAAASGHMDLVQFFIEKGAHNWNLGLDGAVTSGKEDLIKFFIDKGGILL